MSKIFIYTFFKHYHVYFCNKILLSLFIFFELGDCDIIEVELVDYLNQVCTNNDLVQFDEWLDAFFLNNSTKPLKIKVLSINVLETVVKILRLN